MKIQNVEDMRKAYPDLVAEVENVAWTAGVTAERQRIQTIENMQGAVVDAAMVKNAKFGENPMTAEAFAIAALTAQASAGKTELDGLNADAAMQKQAGVGGQVVVNKVNNNTASDTGDVTNAPRHQITRIGPMMGIPWPRRNAGFVV